MFEIIWRSGFRLYLDIRDATIIIAISLTLKCLGFLENNTFFILKIQ